MHAVKSQTCMSHQSTAKPHSSDFLILNWRVTWRSFIPVKPGMAGEVLSFWPEEPLPTGQAEPGALVHCREWPPVGKVTLQVPLRVSRGPRKWRAHGMSLPWPSVSQNVDSDWISRTKWRRNSASPLRLTGGNNQASPKESGVWTEEVGGSEHLSPENWSKSYILPTSRVEEAPNSIWGPYCSAVFSRSTD